MYRSGRVGGRARLTRHGVLTQRLSKSALGGTSDRSKRGTAPRHVRSGLDTARRGARTSDVLAFTSAIRGVGFSEPPLFHRTGVMRYDPLKKNVVRPFRAFFSFFLGIVRGVVQSALTVATAPFKRFPIGNFASTSNRGGQDLQVRLGGASEKPSSRPVSLLDSHPIRTLRKSVTVAIPSRNEKPATTTRHVRFPSEPACITPKGDEINEVLKTYNTTQSRDRLITKLQSMKNTHTTAEAIKSLSQRNPTERSSAEQQPSLSRRELLMSTQEMVQLSKQVSNSMERTPGRTPLASPKMAAGSAAASTPHMKHYRSQSFAVRPAAPAKQGSALQSRKSATNAMSPKSHELHMPRAFPVRDNALTVEIGGSAAAQQPADQPSPASRSETLRLKLKQHEQLLDSLKSRCAVKKLHSVKQRIRGDPDSTSST